MLLIMILDFYIFSRHLASVSQTSDASIITVQLTDQGSFMTSPVHISLSEAKTFAWRTRIVSSQGAVSLRALNKML